MKNQLFEKYSISNVPIPSSSLNVSSFEAFLMPERISSTPDASGFAYLWSLMSSNREASADYLVKCGQRAGSEGAYHSNPLDMVVS